MFSIASLLIFLLFFTYNLSDGQQFFPFHSKEYFIEKNTPVTSYFQANENCQNKSAKMAVVNSREIHDFLVEKINLAELGSKY